MNVKLIGSVLIVISCAFVGFQMAAMHRRETNTIKQIITVMEYMEAELIYRHTPLPELCSSAAERSSGMLRDIFMSFSKAFTDHTSSNGENCVKEVLDQFTQFPEVCKKLLLQFGGTVGIFDLNGQVDALKAVKQECHRQLAVRQENQEIRLRSYQTLGICAGAALAIILI